MSAIMESLQEREDILAARKTEFAHAEGVTYLDHAGATLYSSVQLQSYLSDLSSHLYGNPHSQNPSSKLSSDVIEQTRERVLNHFNTDLSHYDLVFTSGCTGALNLLADSFPWAELNEGSRYNHTPRTQNPQGIPCVDSTNVMYLPDHIGSTVKSSSAKERQVHSGLITTAEHSGRSVFCYLEDNHTSVVGMRETAACRGAKVVCATHSNLISNPELDKTHRHETLTNGEATSDSSLTKGTLTSGADSFVPPRHLFAYPAQSNFCGRKYPLSWIQDIPNKQLVFKGLPPLSGSWLVALDAASLVSTSPLDLSSFPAHFVALSFYKMFGFPTGLGALLVRRDCWGLLEKSYYGGGTVAATVSREGFHVPRAELHERLEDGTVSFLSIVALSHGFDALCRIGRSMEDVSLHTFKLAQYVHSSLSHLHHFNGRLVCTLYSHGDFTNHSEQGPIVNFNLVRPDGRVVGYSEVDKLACVYDIHLRTGCFCNTGACMSYLGVSTERVKEHLKAGHVCGDSMDIVNGEPTGSVRVSFGYMSTLKDAQTLIHFIESCFVDHGPSSESETVDTAIVGSQVSSVSIGHVTMPCDCAVVSVGDHMEACTEDQDFHIVGRLTRLTLYPIKSCGGQVISSWPVGEKGLLYDREWVVVGETGAVISQKQEGRLCLVQPSVDLQSNTLTLSYPGYQSLTVPLEPREEVWRHPVTTRVCADRVSGLDCGEEVAEWLSQVLHRPCRLLKQDPDSYRPHKSVSSDNERGTSLSLVNAAQYLLISDSSVEHLCAAVRDRGQKVKLGVADCLSRFRPNFVVGLESTLCEGGGAGDCVTVPNLEPYVEEKWKKVKIGKESFNVNGECNRCQMICVDPATGGRSPEPLKTLMELRGSKVPFGIYLSRNTEIS